MERLEVGRLSIVLWLMEVPAPGRVILVLPRPSATNTAASRPMLSTSRTAFTVTSSPRVA
jgi:hypothetical protein